MTSGKEPACQCSRHKRFEFNPWVRMILWRKKWQPTPLFLSGESHGLKSLAGYSPWGYKESNTTEATKHMHMRRTNWQTIVIKIGCCSERKCTSDVGTWRMSAKYTLC